MEAQKRHDIELRRRPRLARPITLQATTELGDDIADAGREYGRPNAEI